MTVKSKDYLAGQKAFKQGMMSHENPWDARRAGSSRQAAYDWNKGFQDAKAEDTPISHDDEGMYYVKEVSEHRFDVVQRSSGVIVASAALKATAGVAANAINACAVVPRMKA